RPQGARVRLTRLALPVDALAARGRLARLVAGRGHRRAQVGGGQQPGEVGDAGALGGQVDASVDDAVEAFEATLDARRAARAGHAAHRQAGAFGHRIVAGPRDRLEQGGHARLLGVEAHAGALGGQVGGGFAHARHLGQGPLDARGAARARHAADPPAYAFHDFSCSLCEAGDAFTSPGAQVRYLRASISSVTMCSVSPRWLAVATWSRMCDLSTASLTRASAPCTALTCLRMSTQ